MHGETVEFAYDILPKIFIGQFLNQSYLTSNVSNQSLFMVSKTGSFIDHLEIEKLS
jgi:hypothetical protein